MTYTKVRIPTSLALALRYVAASRKVGRQALIQGLLAQVTLAIAPEVSEWEGMQTFGHLPLVPQLEVSEKGVPRSKAVLPLPREEAERYVEEHPRPVKIPDAAKAWIAAQVEEDYDTRLARLIRAKPELSMDKLRALAGDSHD